jgi:hypothetical protein
VSLGQIEKIIIQGLIINPSKTYLNTANYTKTEENKLEEMSKYQFLLVRTERLV